MNIGIDIRPLLTTVRTGVAEYTYELLQALFEIDKKNHYFLFTNAAGGEKLAVKSEWLKLGERENVHVVSTQYPNKLFNSSIQLFKRPRLDKLSAISRQPRREVRGPVSQASGPSAINIWFSPNIGFTALSRNTKQILTIHDLSFEHFPDCYSLKRRLWHKILNPKKQCERADLILTPSENTRRDVINTYKIADEKVKCLYPGVTGDFRFQISDLRLGEVKKKYNLPDKFILFLGTIEPRKNIEGLIEAWFQSHELLAIGYELIIAGPLGWQYKPILRAIEEAQGARYIRAIEHADKATLYRLADLFVYPSLYEGFGFPVLESMSNGTPVITSKRSSLPEVAGDAAYLVNPLNTSEITLAMSEVLTNHEIKNTLVERGKKRVEQFRWGNTARRFLEIIRV